MNTATAQVKERGLICTGESVRGILDGRKTMTRRVINPQVSYQGFSGPPLYNSTWGNFTYPTQSGGWTCPYGLVGDRLWVRETWRPATDWLGTIKGRIALGTKHVDIRFAADIENKQHWMDVPPEQGEKYLHAFTNLVDRRDWKWRPSIFMPRWASRITLEITNVRVERLQDISEADARAEGTANEPYDENYPFIWRDIVPQVVANFHYLWDKINGKKYPWSANPWVWVVEFKKI